VIGPGIGRIQNGAVTQPAQHDTGQQNAEGKNYPRKDDIENHGVDLRRGPAVRQGNFEVLSLRMRGAVGHFQPGP